MEYQYQAPTHSELFEEYRTSAWLGIGPFANNWEREWLNVWYVIAVAKRLLGGGVAALSIGIQRNRIEHLNALCSVWDAYRTYGYTPEIADN